MSEIRRCGYTPIRTFELSRKNARKGNKPSLRLRATEDGDGLAANRTTERLNDFARHGALALLIDGGTVSTRPTHHDHGPS
jgi:hypothetical protein